MKQHNSGRVGLIDLNGNRVPHYHMLSALQYVGNTNQEKFSFKTSCIWKQKHKHVLYNGWTWHDHSSTVNIYIHIV